MHCSIFFENYKIVSCDRGIDFKDLEGSTTKNSNNSIKFGIEIAF